MLFPPARVSRTAVGFGDAGMSSTEIALSISWPILGIIIAWTLGRYFSVGQINVRVYRDFCDTRDSVRDYIVVGEASTDR